MRNLIRKVLEIKTNCFAKEKEDNNRKIKSRFRSSDPWIV